MAADGVKLGDAYIAVTVDARKVGRDLEADVTKSAAKITSALDDALDDVGDDARRAGNAIGDSLADQIADGIRRGMAEADRLGRDVRLRVNADTAGAQTSLRQVDSDVRRLNGRTATVTVQVRKVERGLGNLAGSLGLPLGAALGVMAGGAAAGIGAAAVAGGGALAAGGLGFSGVGNATELLTMRQAAAAQEAASAASAAGPSAAAIAGAQRAVESAEAGLANTRASAAYAAQNAAKAVTKAKQAEADAVVSAAARIDTALAGQRRAEETLADAHDRVRQAQEAVNEARERAQDQLEDLTNSTTANSLAQQKAVYDLADAKADLDAVLNNPQATKKQQDLARIAYEEQLLRQTQLKQQGERLAEQQAEAAEKGVEGSDLVTAAQQQLIDAREAESDALAAVKAAEADVVKARVDGAREVADAQEAVTEAIAAQQEQGRQAAYSISQAQAGVTSAMEALAEASTVAGVAGSSALADIDAELAKVDPATRKFAGFLDETMNPALARIRAAAAGGLLPGVQAGLESVLSQEGRITGFVTRYSTSLGGLLQGTLERLSNPTWSTFFTTLETQGVPTFEALWRSGENIAEALAAIYTAFAPLGTDMAVGLEGLTEDFLGWARAVGDSPEFEEFVAFIKDNWPAVKDIIGDVAGIIVDLVVAGAGIGAGLLGPLQVLTGVLNALPVPVVAALLTAFLGYKAVVGVSQIIDGVTGSARRLSDQASSVSGFLSGLGGGAEKAAGKTGKLSGALSGVVGFLGGPLGIATAGAAALFGMFTSEVAEASKQTDSWAQAITEGGAAATRAMEEARAERDKYGDNWLGDLSYEVDKFFGLASSMEEAEQKAGELWRQMDPLQQATQKQAEWTATLRERLLSGKATDEEVRIAKERLAYWTGEVTNKQELLDGATRGATGAIAEQKTTLDGLTSSKVSANEAEARYWEAVETSKGALDGLSGALLNQHGELDLQSEKGRGAQEVLYGLRDAGNTLIEQMIAQGGTTDQVLAKDAALRQGFIDTAIQMGLSKDAAWRLADQILGIPAQRQTTITADTSQATAAAAALQAAINNLQGRRLTVELAAMEIAPGRYQRSYQTASGGRALGVAFEHDGGIVHAYAKGGIEPKPMPGGIAQVVAPNTWRVIGDRVRDDEAYIPLNTSARSLQILSEAARRMGRAVVDPTSQFMAGGGVLALSAGLTGANRAREEMFNYGADIAFDQLIKAAMAESSLGNVAAAAGAAGGLPNKIFALLQSMVGGGAKFNSGLRAGDSGYHGRGWALDFGKAGTPGGVGNQFMADAAAAIDRAYPASLELIYDGLGDYSPDRKNGRPHSYSLQTQREHRDHVHWVPPMDVINQLVGRYDAGGWLPDGGLGLNTSGVPEPVFTGKQWQLLEANLRPITSQQAPAAVAAGGDRTPIEVTYAPVLQVPRTASADEVNALLQQDLVRSLRLGLLTGSIGSLEASP